MYPYFNPKTPPLLRGESLRPHLNVDALEVFLYPSENGFKLLLNSNLTGDQTRRGRHSLFPLGNAIWKSAEPMTTDCGV